MKRMLIVSVALTWFVLGGTTYAKDYDEHFEKNVQFKNVTVEEEAAILNEEGEFEVLPKKVTREEEIMVYQVQKGDTLSEISYYFEVSIQEILKMNPEIEEADLIYVGQIVRII